MNKKAFCFFAMMISLRMLSQFVMLDHDISLSAEGIHSGNTVSLADFNRDGRDDVTIADKNVGIKAYKNIGNNQFLLEYLFESTAEPRCISWVDYDNDGDSDLFFTCSYCPNQFHRNEGNGVFTDISYSSNLIFENVDAQGCSWGDYDNDGWLDMYLCNYNNQGITNWLFHNEGDGTFTEVAQLLGVDDDSNATFQGVWTDINQDGWLDLFVINDRDDGNHLYCNKGDAFEDTSEISGAYTEMNSMCNSIADYDDDGDFDIYVTNSPAGNALLQNNNGYFQDIAEELDVEVNSACWGGLWIDYDLDGDDDLHVCNVTQLTYQGRNNFFINDGSGGFEAMSGGGLAGDIGESYSSAKADFDSNGYWDFVTTDQLPNSLSIWLNSAESGGNFLKFGLQGVLSNSDGIGSIVTSYYGVTEDLLQTYCNENYLSQDSQYEIVGLGEYGSVDSLIIRWSSGWVDKYFGLEANQFYTFTEGETYLCEIVSSTGNQLCTAGGSLTLSAGEHLSYVWSDASTSSSIDVNAAGIYEVIVTNEYGLQATTTFEVTNFGEIAIETTVQHPLCAESADGTISIVADEQQVANILWSNEQSGPQLQNLSQGEYTYQLTDMNGCEYENTITLADPAPVVASVTTGNILCNGGNTVLSAAASGGTGTYTLQWSLSDPTQAPAGEHSLTVTDANGCSALHIITLDEPSLIVIDNNTQPVCNGEYTAADVSTTGGTGALQQNWNGVDETQLFAGDYSLTVTDANGCATTGVITIVEYAALDATATVTDANEGNNGSILLTATGGVEPYSFYWSNGSMENPLEGIGQGIYTCTVTDSAGCVFYSDNCQLTDTNVEEWNTVTHVFPNPFNNHLVVEAIGTDEVKVYDATGRLMLQKGITKREEIDTATWPSGVYFIHLGKALQHSVCVKE